LQDIRADYPLPGPLCHAPEIEKGGGHFDIPGIVIAEPGIPRLDCGMKLEQGQIWKQGDVYLRIVKWSREEIVYKAIEDLVEKKGEQKTVSKKEFCRLIKGAELMPAKS
jgi:hypothetical protein